MNAWNQALNFTGGDLKLVKCYWNLQAYSWQDGVCTYNTSTFNTISITDNNLYTKIKKVSTDKIKILVGVTIAASNDSYDVGSYYQDKIKRLHMPYEEHKS